jgi:hypothetical protein
LTKYRLDPAGFRRNLLQADFMVAEMHRRAERVKEAAEASAPQDTGEYRSSFKVETVRDGGIHHDRAEGRVVNTDPAALPIEFGHITKAGTFVEGHTP